MPKKSATSAPAAAAPAAAQKKAAPAAAAAPAAGKKAAASKKAAVKPVKGAKVENPLFEKRARQFGIGGDLPPKRDLTRFVRWPKYVKLQRQRRVLYGRLKTPPPINQFTKTVDKASATALFQLLRKYRPETKFGKNKRLQKAAAAKAAGKEAEKPSKPVVIKYGLNHVTHLVEQKKAKLVLIAHDVDPIELVVWLPALCRKLEVPYCIVKGKARLGRLVHKKTAAAVVVTDVKKEDQAKLAELTTQFKEQFNSNVDLRKHWGGGKLGIKSTAALEAKKRAVAREASARSKTV